MRAIISSYIQKYGLVRHQRESFEYFCCTLLPRIVQENSDIVAESSTDKHELRFERVNVGRPTSREADGFVRESHSPQEVMLRGLTYSSPVLVDVSYTVSSKHTKERQTTTFRNLELCRIPMMTKTMFCQSSENESAAAVMCAYEHGGYFIVNASEKGMISQEKLAVNLPFVWLPRGNNKVYCAEMRSCHRDKLRSTSTLYINYKEGTPGKLPNVSVQIPFLEVSLHIYDVFILLGTDETHIDEFICNKSDTVMRSLLSTIASTRKVRRTREELMEYLCQHGTLEKDATKRKQYVTHIFTNEFLPHQGLEDNEETRKQKRMLLGYMIHRLLSVILKRTNADDRDNYCNKRIDCAGMLCSLLFRQLFRHYLKMLQMQVHRCIEHNKEVDVVQVITARKISAGLNYGFATGAWGMQKGGSQTTGVVQILNRNSFVSALANLRRVNTPVNKDSKSSSVRQLHSTSWGIICPTESPEGQACGLVKNLALLSHVRVGTDYSIVKSVVQRFTHLYISLTECDKVPWGLQPLFINGILEGWVQDKDRLLQCLRAERSSKALPFDATIASTERGVIVSTDPGALCRPVFYVPNMHLIPKILANNVPSQLFTTMQDMNVIVYLEKTEEQTFRIALDAKDLANSPCDHAEIHPSLMLGLCTSLIPFPHFNQSPRNVYQAAMGKQSCSVWASNMDERFDTVAYGLMYPQRALCHTWVETNLGLNKIPSGQNLVVTIGCWGYNQEDSIIMNQGFIDRGGGRAFVKRSYSEQETPSGTDVFKIGIPVEGTIGKKFANYDKLNPDTGVVGVGQTVTNGDILVGKTVESYEVGTNKRIVVDCSLSFKHDKAKVESTVHTDNKDGLPCVRIRTSSLRLPCIGDKFTSRHGQKGVIGKIEPSDEMPYIESNGLIPDIIINCHCIPSRMTIGHLLEMLAGSGATIRGQFADSTAFRDVAVEDFASILEEVHGKQGRYGNHTMIKDGQRLHEKFFVGQIYYQRLKHMSCDKKHGRQRGPVALVTRQPLEGRARDGGLKLGEMEQQCLLAHGVATMLQERLFWQSDPNVTPFCQRCGLIAEPQCFDQHSRKSEAGLRNYPFCRTCKSRDYIRNVQIPFAFKVFLQELYTMHIAPRLRIASGTT